MSKYKTIKELVIDTWLSDGGVPSYEKLTTLVRQHFPNSKWKATHYAWYKSMIKRGEIEIPDHSDLVESNDIEEGLDSIDFSLSIEKDLQTYFSRRVAEIEPGLTVIDQGIEYVTDAGRIDLLCRDMADGLVVVELKAGKAKDAALGQLLGYMGCLSQRQDFTGQLRGILVASDFDNRVVYAANGLPNIKLIRYQLAFSLNEITTENRLSGNGP